MASLFLAGGAVRDMLLGRPVHDMDFAFSGTEEDFVQRFPHARKTSEHPPIWVAGGFEFCPLTGGSPDEDVMRRDLTVNALLLDDRGRLYMHPRSLDDLREGVLRPVSTCAFFDDPARVYRLARLAAALVWYGDKRSLREWGLCGPGCGGAASRPGYALWIAQKEE